MRNIRPSTDTRRMRRTIGGTRRTIFIVLLVLIYQHYREVECSSTSTAPQAQSGNTAAHTTSTTAHTTSTTAHTTTSTAAHTTTASTSHQPPESTTSSTPKKKPNSTPIPPPTPSPTLAPTSVPTSPPTVPQAVASAASSTASSAVTISSATSGSSSTSDKSGTFHFLHGRRMDKARWPMLGIGLFAIVGALTMVAAGNCRTKGSKGKSSGEKKMRLVEPDVSDIPYDKQDVVYVKV